MLPDIILQKVSRDDLNRVRNWYRESDSLDGWLGHYSINGVLDIGFDAEKILALSDSELNTLLDNNQNEIRSIYDTDGKHLGESRVLFLTDSAVEISIFIGQSKLANQGYGTSVLLHLMEELFSRYGFKSIIANLPEDNNRLHKLFNSIGFQKSLDPVECLKHDDCTNIIEFRIEKNEYDKRFSDSTFGLSHNSLSITGLVGSLSNSIALKVAELNHLPYVNHELHRDLAIRLRTTQKEIEDFLISSSSFWGRLIAKFVHSHPGYIPGDTLSLASDFLNNSYAFDSSHNHVNLDKKTYLENMKIIFQSIYKENKLSVFYGHGSNIILPQICDAHFSVFITASIDFRVRMISQELEISLDEAKAFVKEQDDEISGIYKNLYRHDIIDMSKYDMVVNLDEISFDTAVNLITNSISTRAVS
ncbi:MAG: GNAT family N-acetyltransferase [SAR202 cluster bacterium]|nr:GNAT family N-acetyltransferase [SAR202 cluster bacterium]|tara:strand:- start:4244 stop:5497 length:1254 start_codon:yes stop_codon:yes gene_type:complete